MKLESCLEDQHQETESLQSRLTTTNEAVEELKLENSGLQQQINEKNRFPISSTPYRPLAPSLHEELANSDLANGMSPVGVMNSSMEELMDSLKTDDNEEKEEGLFEQLASSVSSGGPGYGSAEGRGGEGGGGRRQVLILAFCFFFSML